MWHRTEMSDWEKWPTYILFLQCIKGSHQPKKKIKRRNNQDENLPEQGSKLQSYTSSQNLKHFALFSTISQLYLHPGCCRFHARLWCTYLPKKKNKKINYFEFYLWLRFKNHENSQQSWLKHCLCFILTLIWYCRLVYLVTC